MVPVDFNLIDYLLSVPGTSLHFGKQHQHMDAAIDHKLLLCEVKYIYTRISANYKKYLFKQY